MDFGKINFSRYTRDYLNENPNERETIQKEHIERINQGVEAWNEFDDAFAKYLETNEDEEGFYYFDQTPFYILGVNVSFKGAKFCCDVSFKEAQFGRIVFDGAKFSGGAAFDGAKFRDNACFLEVEFKSTTFFQLAEFKGNADFSKAKFSGHANFMSASFNKEANFSGATFSGNANFRGANFSGPAAFQGATFSGEAIFQGATFSGEAIFEGATFNGYANFDNATFSEAAYFSEATFSGNADFSKATFSEVADFQWATFDGFAIFIGVNTKSLCIFANVKAKKYIPVFAGVDYKIPPSIDGLSVPEPNEELRAEIDSYRQLKMIAIDGANHEMEVKFFGYETQCKFYQGKTPKLFKALIWLYWTFSNFGQNIWRPVLGLFFVFLMACVSTRITVEAGCDPVACANVEYPGAFESKQSAALSQSIDFILPILKADRGTLRQRNQCLYGHDGVPGINRLINFIQQLVSLVFLFLAGLAIRNRFKIK